MVNTKRLIYQATLSTATVAALLGTAPLALADTASNSTTGADSTNIATTQTDNSTTINSNNTANITNNITINANTGGNEANKNTGDANITTGDISGSLTISNSVNSSNINPPLCCDTDSDASNYKTGADSYNKSKVEISNNLTINQNNYMNISNNVGVWLNTGNNEANKNTGDANIDTGDIDFTVGIGNTGNNNTVGDLDDEIAVTPPGATTTDPESEEEDEGEALGAADALPMTGGSLPLGLILSLIAGGLLLRTYEQKARENSLLG